MPRKQKLKCWVCFRLVSCGRVRNEYNATIRKRAELHYDKDTKQLYYEYIDIPKTEIELLQEENEKFKVSQADQDENIMLVMLEMGGN